MKQRIRAISGLEELLVSGWEMCAGPSPDGPWIAAGPTVAAGLRAAGAWSLDGPVRRFDAEHWWFRARLPAADAPEVALCCDGLATLAEVFLDGQPLFSSDNMFRAHEQVLPVGGATGNHELTIHFRPLDAELAKKRPRPRWRAPMIENQQLRWIRATLLGRTPGWSPPAAAVGPWRPVRIERRAGIAVDDVKIQTRLRGDGGEVEIQVRARSLGAPLDPAELIIEHNGGIHRAPVEGGRGCVILPQVERWWPHTHGQPALYHARLRLGEHEAELGHLGFREVTRDGDFSLAVNGVPLFCRGACWTPLDPVALSSDRGALAAALTQARDAGMNMLRVGGTMVYESDDFYDLCDELGILVWQDLMFANMDYPEDDAIFAENVAAEVRQIAARLQARPSLALLCGNSEGEQQAAMFGAPRERWSPKLFHETLPALVREQIPDVPYWPSSAHGGAFPHQADAGTTSYYGVGAYLRPLDDARRAEVKFASECLAFANVPRTVSPSVRVHHPAWKARTPRDLGAGWDFDDVRDHYVERLFGVNALELRYADHDRYLQLGRAATGEVMAAVFGEWRRRRSTCRGGLIWFLRDLWAGAGWGIIDAAGAPKSAYWYVRRAMAPVAAHLSDEGGNGLSIHLVNDHPRALAGELSLSLFRAGEVSVGSARRAVEIPPHDSIELPAAALLDGFSDLTWAYRFGPPSQDLIVATLHSGGAVAAQAFHFPVGLPRARELDLGLVAEHKDGALTVRTRRFAQSIAIDAEGFAPADDWFHLPPGGERTIAMPRVSSHGGTAAPRGTLQPLNCEATTKIVFQCP